MTEKDDKGSVFHILSAYRKRQERAEKLLAFYWIGAMLLVVGVGYLIYRFLLPGTPLRALNITQTPTFTETAIQSTPTATTPAPTATALYDQAETPVPSETLAAASVITYTIQQGDTLAGIAGQYGIGLPTLAALNPFVTPGYLNVGDQISLPAQGEGLATVTPTSPGLQTILEYQVAAGDTLVAIAARFATTIEAIVQENSLESPDQIREGQTLRIPIETGTSPVVTPDQPNSNPGATSTPMPES